MRRFIRNIVICFFICLIGVTALLACGSKEIFDNARLKISEIRNNLFVGKSENLIVSFTSGEREKEYRVDGKSTGNVAFGVITVIVLKDNKFEKTKNFVININGQDISGEFEINPYDNSLVYDIGYSVDDNTLISVSVMLDELYETVALENVSSSWIIKNIDALELACSNLKSDLKKYINDNNFDMEVYIKILFDYDNLENPYFWMVSFVGENLKDISIVLDINSGEVLSKKVV